MKQKKYKVINLPKEKGIFSGGDYTAPTVEALDELGEKGWELITIIPTDGEKMTRYRASAPNTLVFKRSEEWKHWRYKIVNCSEDEGVFSGSDYTAPTVDILDELGEKGWELITVIPTNGEKMTRYRASAPNTLVFKRSNG